MKSSQINFYLTFEDAYEVDNYLKENNFLTCAHPLPENKPYFLDSITQNKRGNIFFTNVKYIVLKENISDIILKYVPEQNHYSVDVMNSPVIEIWYPGIDVETKKCKQGRFYYIKNSLIREEMKEISKNEIFLKESENFFKWIKKHFKNTRISGFNGYLISQRTAKWVKETKGELVLV